MPVSNKNLPTSQFVQSSWRDASVPLSALYFPEGHTSQEAWPEVAAYRPASQIWKRVLARVGGKLGCGYFLKISDAIRAEPSTHLANVGLLEVASGETCRAVVLADVVGRVVADDVSAAGAGVGALGGILCVAGARVRVVCVVRARGAVGPAGAVRVAGGSAGAHKPELAGGGAVLAVAAARAARQGAAGLVDVVAAVCRVVGVEPHIGEVGGARRRMHPSASLGENGCDVV